MSRLLDVSESLDGAADAFFENDQQWALAALTQAKRGLEDAIEDLDEDDPAFALLRGASNDVVQAIELVERGDFPQASPYLNGAANRVEALL